MAAIAQQPRYILQARKPNGAYAVGRWQVGVSKDEAETQWFLDDGWEPFGVTLEGLYFRKRVERP